MALRRRELSEQRPPPSRARSHLRTEVGVEVRPVIPSNLSPRERLGDVTQVVTVPNEVSVANRRGLVGDGEGNHRAVRENRARAATAATVEAFPAEDKSHVVGPVASAVAQFRGPVVSLHGNPAARIVDACRSLTPSSLPIVIEVPSLRASSPMWSPIARQDHPATQGLLWREQVGLDARAILEADARSRVEPWLALKPVEGGEGRFVDLVHLADDLPRVPSRAGRDESSRDRRDEMKWRCESGRPG
jgi:hypothetical protein